MTAAFDAVHHSILLQRLQRSYGISGNPLAWFTSYLAARAQSVRFRHKKSHSCHVPHGVPQGSVLGPLLFILYVGNVAEIPERLGLGSHFYADDAQLYLTCRRDDCHMCQSRLQLHQRNWQVDGGKSFGNESNKDGCLMVFHKSPTIWSTTLRYSFVK